MYETLRGDYVLHFRSADDMDRFRQAWDTVVEREGYDEAVAMVEDLAGRHHGLVEGRLHAEDEEPDEKPAITSETAPLLERIAKLEAAARMAVRYFEGPNDELGGCQRWQTELNTGGKQAYMALKKALEGERALDGQEGRQESAAAEQRYYEPEQHDFGMNHDR